MFCPYLEYDKFDLVKTKNVRTYCNALDKPCRQVKTSDCPNIRSRRYGK